MIIPFLCQELDFKKHSKYLKQRFKETKHDENERNFVMRPLNLILPLRSAVAARLKYKRLLPLYLPLPTDYTQ